MNTFKWIWILALTTLLIGVICWSIVRITLKTEKLMDASVGVMDSAKEIGNSTADIYNQVRNWISAFFPQELCADIRQYTRDYYQQYGKDDLRLVFDTLKGEAAKRKLAPIR